MNVFEPKQKSSGAPFQDKPFAGSSKDPAFSGTSSRVIEGISGFASAALKIWQQNDIELVLKQFLSVRRACEALGEIKQSIESNEVNGLTCERSSTCPPALLEPSRVIGYLQSFPITKLASGSALAIVSSGLGLLTIGVGLCNSYQLRKVNQQLSALSDQLSIGFQQVETAFRIQSNQLALLQTGVANLICRIDAINQQIDNGFCNLSEQLRSSEARRLADEYYERLNKIGIVQAEVHHALSLHETPHPADVRRLADSAHDLAAWTSSQLRNYHAKSIERLPLFVAKSLALRSLADASFLEKGTRSTLAIQRLNELVLEIEREVWNIVDGQTLFVLGCHLPDIIAQYIYLRRGLKLGEHDHGDPNSNPSTELLAWEDGLSTLRSIFIETENLNTNDEEVPLSVPLATLGDLKWYIEWKQADPEVEDLRGVKAVELGEVAKRLGASTMPLIKSDSDLVLFLAISLPHYADHAIDRLVAEFGWEEKPSLTICSA